MNNKIYERNLKALIKHYPEIAERLENTVVKNYEIYYESSDSMPNIYIKATDSYYYGLENPLQDAANQVNLLKLKNAKIAVFLGLGLGYEFFYFSEYLAKEKDTRFIFVVEKDMEIFKLAMENIDLTLMICHPQLKLIVGADETELFLQCRDYFGKVSRCGLYIKAAKPVYHISALKLYKEYYIKALQKFREAGLYDLGISGNSPEDSIIGLKNILANINEIIDNPGINLLYDEFKGKPAIVVSTGPSLNKNKHLLKGLEDKAVIIAADSALRILNEIDVKPHFVTMLERDKKMHKLIEGFDIEEVKDTYFAACPVIYPESYDVYPGPKMIVYRAFDHFKWIGIDRGMLSIKQSAGNMSFKIATALGCDPIILIGQDLSFSREGHTHAKGMVFGHERENEKNRGLLEVMGNDGEMIITNEVWNLFLKSYEIDVAEYKGVCINSTEGGAYIKGTEVMPFRESIEKYISESFNPLKIIKGKFKEFEPNLKEKEKLNSIVDKTLVDMEAIVKWCEKGIETYRKYEDELLDFIKNHSKADENIKSRIDFLKKEILNPKSELQKNRETFQLFFMHIIQPYHVNFEVNMNGIPDAYEDSTIAMADILYKHADWYNTIGDIAKICVDLLKETKKTLGDGEIGDKIC